MAPRPPSDGDAGGARRRPRHGALPLIGESTVPWLVGAVVIAVLGLALVVKGDVPVAVQAVLGLGLAATLATAGLVAARSNRRIEAETREERARPAADELAGGPEKLSASYVEGMEPWISAVLELIEHALSVTEPGTAAHTELTTAAADTRDLRDLMAAGPVGSLSLNDQARLHALGSLWETSQRRVENLAADADPAFHRRWRARSVVERQLRHGQDPADPFVPPYRT